MDERQAQIRERAGLEESRLNLEFIEWLRKWGTPLLIVVALSALGYALRERYIKSQHANTDQAFREFEAAIAGGNASPDALLAVARDFDGVRSVSILARLEAADAYMDAVRKGIKPGAQVQPPNGDLVDPNDAMTDANREEYLSKADDLYQQVYTTTASNPDQVLLAIGALYGQAAVSESRAEWDKAKTHYEQVIKVAEASAFTSHAAVAKSRIERLDQLKQLPRLYSRAELPQPEPVPTDVTITPVEGAPPTGDPFVPPTDAQPEPQPEPQPETVPPSGEPAPPK